MKLHNITPVSAALGLLCFFFFPWVSCGQDVTMTGSSLIGSRLYSEPLFLIVVVVMWVSFLWYLVCSMRGKVESAKAPILILTAIALSVMIYKYFDLTKSSFGESLAEIRKYAKEQTAADTSLEDYNRTMGIEIRWGYWFMIGSIVACFAGALAIPWPSANYSDEEHIHPP